MNQNDVDEELLKMVIFPSFQLVGGTMYYFRVNSSYALIIYKSPRPPEEVRTVPPNIYQDYNILPQRNK